MRGILIDPATKTISEIDHAGSLQALYTTLGCAQVERVALAPLEYVWVDEEGLLKPDAGPFFQIGPNIPMAGKALCLGDDDEGGIRECRLPLWILQLSVSFPDLALVGWEQTEGIEQTAIGPMPFIQRLPIFTRLPQPGEIN